MRTRRWRKLKRLGAVLLALLALAIWQPAATSAADTPGPDEVLKTQIESLRTEEMDAFIAALDDETRRFFPELDLRRLSQGQGVDWAGIWGAIAGRLFREIALNKRFIAEMIILAVLCVVLRHLQLSDGGPAEMAFAVGFLAVFVLGIHGFGVAQQVARSAVDQMTGFMYALLPMMVTLLASAGGLATASMVHPLMVAAIGLTGRLIGGVVLPLAFFAAVVGAVGQLSDKYPLSKLAGLLRTVTTGILGFGLCIFMGVVTVRGLVAAVADGLTIRTAKFVSGSFVPVVGKFFSDAMDLIGGCSLLLKNSLGVFGAAGLLIVCAFPAVKILVLSLLYRLVGALLQPLGEPRLAEALTSIGAALTLVFAAVAVAGLMFLIGVAVLVGLSNLTVMAR